VTVAAGKPEASGANLRIVDADLQLNQAFDLFERTLQAWAGGRADEWRKDGPRGVAEEGSTYARRDDVYVSVAMTDETAAIGVALMPGDRAILDIALPRRGPGRDRRRAALAVDDNGDVFLLAAEESLRERGVREPFRRMAGHAFAKRARVAGRDYLMLGPLAQAGVVDAILALAALHPTFEAHLDRLARLDAPAPMGVWRVSDGLARVHRGAEKAAFAAALALRRAEFVLIDPLPGPFAVDVAARRGEAYLAVRAVRDASAETLAQAAGALALAAPACDGWTRILLAPAPRAADDPALAAFADALAEMGITLTTFDVRDDAMHLHTLGPPLAGAAVLGG